LEKNRARFGGVLTQRVWRIAGAVAIAGSALMAWYGVRLPVLRESPVYFLIYWGIFLVLLLAAVYCALLDIRYIRAEYAVQQRQVFRETLGDEKFRRELRTAQSQSAKEREPQDPTT
jgi:hypothetical protein